MCWTQYSKFVAKSCERLESVLDCDDLVGAAFIDLSKAFDSGLLLAKLSGYGFDDGSLRWFTDYLSHRRHHVVLDHTFSDWATVVRGVPQVSVLGP